MKYSDYLERAFSEGVFNSIKNQKFDFKKYMKLNPESWDLFQHYTLEAIDNNFTKLSATAIISRIRWESQMIKDQTNKYKIQDHARPYFAKLFIFMYPEHSGLFSFKIGGVDEKYIKEEKSPCFACDGTGIDPVSGLKCAICN